jgi:hypothetical protein
MRMVGGDRRIEGIKQGGVIGPSPNQQWGGRPIFFLPPDVLPIALLLCLICFFRSLLHMVMWKMFTL